MTYGVLWPPGARSTTASGLTARSTTARHRSSNVPSKGEGPWPLSLRQPQPSTQPRISSYERVRKRGQVIGAVPILFHHALQTPNLTSNSPEPPQVRRFDPRV